MIDLTPLLALATDTTVPSRVITLPTYIDVAAVTAGALSGALHASQRRLDLMGVMVVALCTGVGGGAIRDVLLNSGVPVFLESPTLLPITALAAVIGTFFASLVRQVNSLIWAVDSLVIGVWVVIGVQKSLLLNLSFVAAAFVGVVACVGGSLLRDVLCQDKPAIFRPGTFYAAAAGAGAAAYLALAAVGAPVWSSVTAAIVVSTSLRAASVHWGWETSMAPIVSEPGGELRST